MWLPYASAFHFTEGGQTHLRTQKGDFAITSKNAPVQNILRLADGTRTADHIADLLSKRFDRKDVLALLKKMRSIAALVPANRRYELFHHATNNPQIALPEVPANRFSQYAQQQLRRSWAGAVSEVEVCRTHFGKLLKQRMSCRNFKSGSITPKDLATILWSAHGVVDRSLEHATNVQARTVPSGGGLFPLYLFVWANRVSKLVRGAYFWDPNGRLIERNREGFSLVKSSLVDSRYATTSSAIILVTADLARSVRKYGDRGYRYALLEAGHVTQNAVLSATELKMGSLVLGGFIESKAKKAFGVPRSLSPIVMICLGKK